MSTISACPNCIDDVLTANCTVDAVMATSPGAKSVFGGFGIDTCCGGRATLEEASLSARVAVDVLIDALKNVAPATAAPAPEAVASNCSCGCGH